MVNKVTALLSWDNYTVHTWCLEAGNGTSNSPAVVMLHGAGAADSGRSEGLAHAFADLGVRVISFDFVGHGQSTGTIREMSLRRRTDLAAAVIRHWTKPTDQIIPCAFSMSGHTALMLTERLHGRIPAISLMAPGVYAKEAETVPFTEVFSTIIRRKNSWENSLALRQAAEFTGKVHMLMSTHDEVIPWGVAEQLLAAFRKKAAEVRFDLLHEPDHRVASWLSDRPERGHDIIRYLLR